MKMRFVFTFLGVVSCAFILLGSAWAIGQQGGEGSKSIANSAVEVWGGRGVRMKMYDKGATLEFDCAHGTIAQPFDPDANGNFSVPGTYTPERGGPVRKDSAGNAQPATYKGSIHGDTMQLEIVPENSSQTPPAMTLTRGQAGRLLKCR